MSSEIDPKVRFSGVVAEYARWRPTYPAQAIDWLLRGVPHGGRAVDLGCGTGIASRLLSARGLQVVGIDPNENMLARARAEGGGPDYRMGEASNTGLPDRWADLACGFQSFHWFDLAAVQLELRRVLRPGAPCAAVWNVRAPSPLMDEFEAMLQKSSSDYRELSSGEDTLAALKALPGAAGFEMAEFAHEQPLDREGFWGRVHSSSYVALGVPDLARFRYEVEELFEKHQKDGRASFSYNTVCLLFRP